MEAKSKNTQFSEKQLNLTEHNREENILCLHCRRTAQNGIRCIGLCVADSEY